MPFNPTAYGQQVAELLALDADGNRLMPLVAGPCTLDEARTLLANHKAAELFPKAQSPEAALGGLLLYFSCRDEAHEIVQNLHSADGSFWHAILHRQEPDSGNAAYWFRRTGGHPVFRDLCKAAEAILHAHPEAEFRTGGKWDPFSFILFCERARQQPGSPHEQAALEIQRAEWQLLFDYCARPNL